MKSFSSDGPGHWLDAEPTDEALMVIEAEMPVIQAELILLDDEIKRLSHDVASEPPVRRRVRRHRRRVMAAINWAGVAR